MREDWNRTAAALRLSLAELTHLIQPAFPGRAVVESEVTQGGLANTNIRIRLSGDGPPLLVRLYTRSPIEGRKEAALHRRVAGQVPVPRFLYFAEEGPATQHPYAIMEWVAGQRLEVAARAMDRAQIESAGRSVGAALAGIHAITFPQTGFLDADLNVAQPISVGGAGLAGFLHACLVDGRGQARLGEALTRQVIAFAAREAGLLDTWQGPPCLAHSDFGGSNILVRRTETGAGWEVAAVLDWEFAFSGSPFFDFGNLLRPPLGDMPGFERAVYEGYTRAGGRLPDRWREMSRLADLTAWADFLNRPEANEALVRTARAIMTRTIEGEEDRAG
jgi:aminoglycoside phosphotransferase (APT) family kinase protein